MSALAEGTGISTSARRAMRRDAYEARLERDAAEQVERDAERDAHEHFLAIQEAKAQSVAEVRAATPARLEAAAQAYGHARTRVEQLLAGGFVGPSTTQIELAPLVESLEDLVNLRGEYEAALNAAYDFDCIGDHVRVLPLSQAHLGMSEHSTGTRPADILLRALNLVGRA